MSSKDAIDRFVKDGMIVHLGGFGHLYPYSLTHEVIRQRKRSLTICKHSPELLADQLIGAGCVNKLIFGFMGNPGVAPAYCFDRAIHQNIPEPIQLEEYSHHGLTTRLRAASYGLSFLPTKSMFASDYSKITPNIKTIICPFSGEKYVALPSLNPDVTLIHVQRVDYDGNAQAWGVLGDIVEGAFASKKVIVSTEEIVSNDIIRRDPNRTIIPGFKVDAVVKSPWGSHPSYTQGYYDRDNKYYSEYADSTKTLEGFEKWLLTWFDDVEDRDEYVGKLGDSRLKSLRPSDYSSYPVNYGRYSDWRTT